MAECSPDWVATLRRASFRGAAFFVESDDIDYGRRIQTHQFPNRDRPFQEDLGEEAIKFSVTAYVASDEVLTEKNALVAACRRRGAGSLVLPTEGRLKVVCFSCKRTHNKDRLGYIAFSLTFGEAGAAFGLFTVSMLSRLVGVAVDEAIPSIKRDFVEVYSAIDEGVSAVVSATAAIQSWAERIDEARLRIRTSPEAGTALATEIATAHQRAQEMAYDGAGVSYGGELIDARRGDASGELVDVAVSLLAGLRLAATDDVEVFEALLDLAQPVPASPVIGEGIGARIEAENERVINGAFSRAALLQLAVAAADMEFGYREMAVRVRAQVADAFEFELRQARGPAFLALDKVRGKVAAAISAQVADLRPTVTVTGNVSEPAVVWAYRLYADANRWGDLVRRNRVRHPAYMPPTFEAEAP